MADVKKTAPRHRSFGKRKTVEAKPVTFGFFDDDNYVFECKPRLQGAVILDFVAASTEDEGAAAAGHMVDLIRKALKDETERTRFDDLIYSDDPELVIEIEELGEVVSYLVEEYTTRPTQGSEQ
jgi:hypothetical protein